MCGTQCTTPECMLSAVQLNWLARFRRWLALVQFHARAPMQTMASTHRETLETLDAARKAAEARLAEEKAVRERMMAAAASGNFSVLAAAAAGGGGLQGGVVGARPAGSPGTGMDVLSLSTTELQSRWGVSMQVRAPISLQPCLPCQLQPHLHAAGLFSHPSLRYEL
jgi:hypothetical protein